MQPTNNPSANQNSPPPQQPVAPPSQLPVAQLVPAEPVPQPRR